MTLQNEYKTVKLIGAEGETLAVTGLDERATWRCHGGTNRRIEISIRHDG